MMNRKDKKGKQLLLIEKRWKLKTDLNKRLEKLRLTSYRETLALWKNGNRKEWVTGRSTNRSRKKERENN
jgi:hypothetical protein